MNIDCLETVIADGFLYNIERLATGSSFYYKLNPVKDGPFLIVSNTGIDIYSPNKQHKLE